MVFIDVENITNTKFFKCNDRDSMLQRNKLRQKPYPATALSMICLQQLQTMRVRDIWFLPLISVIVAHLRYDGKTKAFSI